MIFLFVTGERYAYMDNILATLHLPTGMIYRYKYPQDRVEDLVRVENCQKDEKAIISYIDKRTGDGTCTFLRTGVLTKAAEQDGLLHYAVRLGEYGDTKDEKAYSIFLKNSFGEKLYHRNPQGYSRGMLVLRMNDCIWETQGKEHIRHTKESWINTAKALAGKKLFQDNYTIFTRLAIFYIKKNSIIDFYEDMPEENEKMIQVLHENKNEGYPLKVGKKYLLVLSYYIDQYNCSPMTDIHAHWEDSNGFCGLSCNNFEIGSKQDVATVTLCPQENCKQATSNLRLRIDENNLYGKKVVYFQKPLRILVKKPFFGAKTVGMILLLALMTALNYFASMPFGEIFSKYEAEASDALAQVSGWQQVMYQIVPVFGADWTGGFCNIMVSLAGAVATFFLVKLFGSADPLS